MSRKLLARLAVAVPSVGASMSALAAVPADITTAMADIGTDAATVATVVIVAIAVVFAVKFLRRGF